MEDEVEELGQTLDDILALGQGLDDEDYKAELSVSILICIKEIMFKRDYLGITK